MSNDATSTEAPRLLAAQLIEKPLPQPRKRSKPTSNTAAVETVKVAPPAVEVFTGDCRQVLSQLKAESVHAVVTSIPYWGMRSYGGLAGEIGCEPTLSEYLANIAEVFAHVHRVLRADGTLWLNVGDKYSQDSKWGGGRSNSNKNGHSTEAGYRTLKLKSGFPNKSLLGVPWRVAFALQDAGWLLRQDIIWEKTNAMPSSVKDRPTGVHEYMFLFSKKSRYFYDAEAIKERAIRPGAVQTFGGAKGRAYTPPETDPNFRSGSEQWGRQVRCAETRNRRSVWPIATQPFKGEHYATYPEALVEPCILAATSAAGCCPKCATPYQRVVAHKANYTKREASRASANLKPTKVDSTGWEPPTVQTLGWRSGCQCHQLAVLEQQQFHSTSDGIRPPPDDGEDATQTPTPFSLSDSIIQTVPCVVLDPFGGSGTTARVALRLGRSCKLIELNPDYLRHIHSRIDGVQVPLLTT